MCAACLPSSYWILPHPVTTSAEQVETINYSFWSSRSVKFSRRKILPYMLLLRIHTSHYRGASVRTGKLSRLQQPRRRKDIVVGHTCLLALDCHGSRFVIVNESVGCRETREQKKTTQQHLRVKEAVIFLNDGRRAFARMFMGESTNPPVPRCSMIVFLVI